MGNGEEEREAGKIGEREEEEDRNKIGDVQEERVRKKIGDMEEEKEGGNGMCRGRRGKEEVVEKEEEGEGNEMGEECRRKWYGRK